MEPWQVSADEAHIRWQMCVGCQMPQLFDEEVLIAHWMCTCGTVNEFDPEDDLSWSDSRKHAVGRPSEPPSAPAHDRALRRDHRWASRARRLIPPPPDARGVPSPCDTTAADRATGGSRRRDHPKRGGGSSAKAAPPRTLEHMVQRNMERRRI